MTDPGTQAYLAKVEAVSLQKRFDHDQRRQQISVARLRRAKAAEREATEAWAMAATYASRVEKAGAELRVARQTIDDLKEQLNKEINRGRQLEVEIAKLHVEIVSGLKSQTSSEPTTDSISQVVSPQHS